MLHKTVYYRLHTLQMNCLNLLQFLPAKVWHCIVYIFWLFQDVCWQWDLIACHSLILNRNHIRAWSCCHTAYIWDVDLVVFMLFSEHIDLNQLNTCNGWTDANCIRQRKPPNWCKIRGNTISTLDIRRRIIVIIHCCGKSPRMMNYLAGWEQDHTVWTHGPWTYTKHLFVHSYYILYFQHPIWRVQWWYTVTHKEKL